MKLAEARERIFDLEMHLKMSRDCTKELRDEVTLLETECKERVAEKMEWLGERGTLQAEVARLTGIVTAMEEGCYVCQHPKRVDELTCQKNALQQVVREREEQNAHLQSSLTLSREEGRREGREEAARIALERLMAMGYPLRADDIAAAIRSEAKGERG